MRTRTKGLIAGSVALMALATTVISGFEGRELRAYQDIVGVWTICEGETKGVKQGDVATHAECDTMIAKNIRYYEAGLDKCLLVEVSGKTKVAWVSWTLNVGIGAACSSTLVKLANAGRLAAACDELLKWTRAGGRVVGGLVKRRQAERVLCHEGLAGS